MGSAAGALKTAAKRVGVSVAAYIEKTDGGLKWCTAHKDWHSVSDFPVDRSRTDGRKAKCLAADRGKPRHPRDPMRERARNAVFRAVKVGRLPHPNSVPCMDCGHEYSAGERRHEHDHHLGYEPERNLDVQAVCTLCHADREKKCGRQNRN